MCVRILSCGIRHLSAVYNYTIIYIEARWRAHRAGQHAQAGKRRFSAIYLRVCVTHNAHAHRQFNCYDAYARCVRVVADRKPVAVKLGSACALCVHARERFTTCTSRCERVRLTHRKSDRRKNNDVYCRCRRTHIKCKSFDWAFVQRAYIHRH